MVDVNEWIRRTHKDLESSKAEIATLRAELEQMKRERDSFKTAFLSGASLRASVAEAERDRLAERVAELEKALEPFAEYGAILISQKVRDDSVMLDLFDRKITVSDFRNAARTARSLVKGGGDE